MAMNKTGLLAACAVLDDLAEGRQPDTRQLPIAAQAMSVLHVSQPRWRDITEAWFGLRGLAEGGQLNLDAHGRERAACLAQVVRSLVDPV
jgi:hypothetical protein